jgi:DNA-binding beta-propeller fold protein YncE
VFQTVHTQALVTRVSTCPFQIKATIPVVSRPLQVQITPDGSTAIVTSFDNAVNFISVATNQVINTLHTDASINPQAIAISADGTRAYVTSFNITNPVVLVIDITSTTAPKILATIPTIQYPSGAFLTPDNSQLWITSAIASSVDIIDTLTNTDVTGLALGLTTEVAFNSTGTRAYITSATSTPGTVAVVDTATYQILKTYTVGAGPTDIAMSYGDQFLVVNNNNDGSVSVIDLLKNTVLTTKVGPSPSGISFVH